MYNNKENPLIHVSCKPPDDDRRTVCAESCTQNDGRTLKMTLTLLRGNLEERGGGHR